MTGRVIENERFKSFFSKDYNYRFDKLTGNFERWGCNYNSDPQYGPGPELLDIEVTTICEGPGGISCPMCYKDNSICGKNMPFDIFQIILDKMPKTLTQMAIGCDAQAKSNPDLWKMMEYANKCGIIPNITVADISKETANMISRYCGAAAVSRNSNKDFCYNSVKKLTDTGMDQINIHHCIYEENLTEILELMNDYQKDPRLKDLNAIILLSLKQKGRGIDLNPLSYKNFKYLVRKAFSLHVPLGFDSCTANKFMTVARELFSKEKCQEIEVYCEPCESSCFSSYISVDGNFYPCSFVEGETGWEDGIDVVNCKDFISDIWFNERTCNFRRKLLENRRECPIFQI